MKGKFLLAIDQGTSSSRTVIYGHDAASSPAPAGVSADLSAAGLGRARPGSDLGLCHCVTRGAMQKAGAVAADISAIGITNQRETTLIWDRDTGECVYNAIVWQDRRTAEYCQRSRRWPRSDGQQQDRAASRPLFLGHQDRLDSRQCRWRSRTAEAGKLAFGTIDCFLLWRLTGGRSTPPMRPTRRARCCSIFIRRNGMTSCWRCSRFLGAACRRCVTARGLRLASTLCIGGEVPVCGIAGDQQAALIGQAGFEPGMTKSTYGTGCFVVANTGRRRCTPRISC